MSTLYAHKIMNIILYTLLRIFGTKATQKYMFFFAIFSQANQFSSIFIKLSNVTSKKCEVLIKEEKTSLLVNNHNRFIVPFCKRTPSVRQPPEIIEFV